MTEQLQALNDAQQLIYSRANIARAYQGFDESDIAGLYRRDDDLLVVRTDGTEQVFPADKVKEAFVSYTSRLKDFFAYLGPNYRGPSIWRNNAYVMMKGWNYASQGSYRTYHAQMQTKWIDKFAQISNQEQLLALLQGETTDLGHLVAPDGLRLRTLPSHLVDEDVDSVGDEPEVHRPYCSCGSFQRQLQLLPRLQEEIPGYQASCIHITWFNRYRQLLVRRTQLRDQCRGNVAQQATAWAYAPPAIGETHGRFMVLYTKHGSMAPLSSWRQYKPKEVFTQEDAWSLFDAMMDAGFVPFPAVALPQLSQAFRKSNNDQASE